MSYESWWNNLGEDSLREIADTYGESDDNYRGYYDSQVSRSSSPTSLSTSSPFTPSSSPSQGSQMSTTDPAMIQAYKDRAIGSSIPKEYANWWVDVAKEDPERIERSWNLGGGKDQWAPNAQGVWSIKPEVLAADSRVTQAQIDERRNNGSYGGAANVNTTPLIDPRTVKGVNYANLSGNQATNFGIDPSPTGDDSLRNPYTIKPGSPGWRTGATNPYSAPSAASSAPNASPTRSPFDVDIFAGTPYAGTGGIKPPRGGSLPPGYPNTTGGDRMYAGGSATFDERAGGWFENGGWAGTGAGGPQAPGDMNYGGGANNGVESPGYQDPGDTGASSIRHNGDGTFTYTDPRTGQTYTEQDRVISLDPRESMPGGFGGGGVRGGDNPYGAVGHALRQNPDGSFSSVPLGGDPYGGEWMTTEQRQRQREASNAQSGDLAKYKQDVMQAVQSGRITQEEANRHLQAAQQHFEQGGGDDGMRYHGNMTAVPPRGTGGFKPSRGGASQPPANANTSPQFDDPSSKLLEDYAVNQYNNRMNPAAGSGTALFEQTARELMETLKQPAYSQHDESVIKTKATDDINKERDATKQRWLEEMQRRGIPPSSGIALDGLSKIENHFSGLRTTVDREFATDAIARTREQRGERLNVASQLSDAEEGRLRDAGNYARMPYDLSDKAYGRNLSLVQLLNGINSGNRTLDLEERKFGEGSALEREKLNLEGKRLNEGSVMDRLRLALEGKRLDEGSTLDRARLALDKLKYGGDYDLRLRELGITEDGVRSGNRSQLTNGMMQYLAYLFG